MAVTDVIDPALTEPRRREGLAALDLAALADDAEATGLADRLTRIVDQDEGSGPVRVSAFNSCI